jgi:tripartite-type tricarboxylate transporter receptor subunit TctC
VIRLRTVLPPAQQSGARSTRRERTRRALASVLLLVGVSCWAAAALAQAVYPAKPIRIVVPYTPGGGVDVLARVVGGKLTEAWGQPAVIDHRPGGSATLGPALVAKSPPDGHTLVLVTTGFTMTPGLQKVPYDRCSISRRSL